MSLDYMYDYGLNWHTSIQTIIDTDGNY